LINIIGAVAFSPDNELLATGNDKGHVKTWKWATGEEQHVLGSVYKHISWSTIVGIDG
jgi:WD40 repeat protein